VLPNFDNIKSTKRVRTLWQQGIPDAVRGRAWFLALGNRGAVTKDLFEIMAERGLKLKSLLRT
jgi:hypothetical protein